MSAIQQLQRRLASVKDFGVRTTMVRSDERKPFGHSDPKITGNGQLPSRGHPAVPQVASHMVTSHFYTPVFELAWSDTDVPNPKAR